MVPEALAPMPEGIIAADVNLRAMVDQCFDLALSERVKSQNAQRVYNAAALPIGIRDRIPPDMGVGYWDFFRPNDQLIVGVADANYKQDEWITAEGERHFKLRLVLSGTLINKAGEVIATGPQAHFHSSIDYGSEGYWVKADQQTKIVMLQCRADLLADVLSLSGDQTPAPFDRFFRSGGGVESQTFPLSPCVSRMAKQIIEARSAHPLSLRSKSIEATSLAILCTIIGEFAKRETAKGPRSNLNTRDLNRIYEAHRFLANNFVSPPRITELARKFGVNQTKLKSGFKSVFGLTIYDYITQLRMENAADLLRGGECSVADVAYSVGYEYPANFTCAFRRYFGDVPRGLLKQSA